MTIKRLVDHNWRHLMWTLDINKPTKKYYYSYMGALICVLISGSSWGLLVAASGVHDSDATSVLRRDSTKTSDHSTLGSGTYVTSRRVTFDLDTFSALCLEWTRGSRLGKFRRSCRNIFAGKFLIHFCSTF